MVTFNRTGYTTIESLLNSVADDMIANGFNAVYDDRLNSGVVIMEPDLTVDPLQTTQPWRVAFDIKKSYPIQYLKSVDAGSYNYQTAVSAGNSMMGRIVLATPIQLTDDGDIESLPRNPDIRQEDPDYKLDLITPGEIKGIMTTYTVNPARPATYTLSITNRGFVLSITVDAEDQGRGQFWVAVQRLANAETGEILVVGHSPVIGMYWREEDVEQDVYNSNTAYPGGTGYEPIYTAYYSGVSQNIEVRQITVRESDVHAAAIEVPVSKFSNYLNRNINKKKQISISNNDEYIINIPDGINTHRHLYHNERMDMIGFISANVIAENIFAEVAMHGEPYKRKYKAQRCSGGTVRTEDGYTEGYRFMILTKEGDVA